MENASKALLIAGSILIVILLIAFGMRIFNSTSDTTDSVETTMKTTEISTFNSKFADYAGSKKTVAQAKALAEAEGILKKAEAMKEYGDAAREQMKIDALKVLFEQYPKIAEAIGKGYANIGEIKMFGGDTSQLANNIMNTVTQVSEGLESSMGIDIKSLLSGFLGGKIASGNTKRLAVDNDCDCDEEEAW